MVSALRGWLSRIAILSASGGPSGRCSERSEHSEAILIIPVTLLSQKSATYLDTVPNLTNLAPSSGRGGTTLLRQRAPRSCTVFVMTPPNELTSEGGRGDRGVPCSRYPPPPPGRALVVALLRAFRHGALRRPDAADTCG